MSEAAATSRIAILKRGQRVMVSYGQTQIMAAPAQFARKGRIASRRDALRGWYEVEIDWDVTTSTPVLVTAHLAALTVL